MANGAIENDWIEWKGGECPVHGMTPVIPQFRADPDRETAERDAGGKGISAHSYQWDHTGGGADIIAYRVVSA